MSNLKIEVSDMNMEFVIEPYCLKTYKKFITLFDDNKKFDARKYGSIKSQIEANKNFITASTQLKVYKRFFESQGTCNAFQYKLDTNEHKHHMNTFYQRYIKLGNLIKQNSVLFQHFGLASSFADRNKCENALVDLHKVCVTHVWKEETPIMVLKKEGLMDVEEVEEIRLEFRYENLRLLQNTIWYAVSGLWRKLYATKDFRNGKHVIGAVFD